MIKVLIEALEKAMRQSVDYRNHPDEEIKEFNDDLQKLAKLIQDLLNEYL